MMTRLQHAGAMFAVIVFASPGCGGAGDNLPREPIAGTVSLAGQPLQSGMIQFRPATEKEAIMSGGIITEGRFEVPREAGPVPGNYSVMIFATQPNSDPATAKGLMPGSEPKAPRNTTAVVIPVRYNMQTELTAQVKSGGPNSYTFDLKK